MPPKGKKMNLGEFLGAHAAPPASDLPDAPSGLPDPRFQRNEEGRWERVARADRDDEDGPSRADDDDMWRRGPAGGGRDGGRDGGDYGDERRGALPSEVDRASDWRSMRAGAAAGGGGDDRGDRDRDVMPPVRRDVDEASQWRRGDAPPQSNDRFERGFGHGRSFDRDDRREDDRYGPPRGGGGDRYEPRGGDRFGDDRRGGDDRYGPPRGGDRFGDDRRGGDDRYGPPRGGDRFGDDRFGGGRDDDRFAQREDRYGSNDRFGRQSDDRFGRREDGDRFAQRGDDKYSSNDRFGRPAERAAPVDDEPLGNANGIAAPTGAAAAAPAEDKPELTEEEKKAAAEKKAKADAEWKAERESSGYKPLHVRMAEKKAKAEADRLAAEKAAAEEAANPKPKEEEKPAGPIRAKKVKKIDPNAKLDPFGGAAPMRKDPTQASGVSAAAAPVAVKPLAKPQGKYVPAHLRGRVADSGVSTQRAGAKYNPDAVVGGKLQPGAVPKVVTDNTAAANSIWAKKKPVTKEVEVDGQKLVNLAADQTTALEAAVTAAEGEVDDAQLAEGFARLDLASADVRAGLQAVLVQSLSSSKLGLKAVADAVEEHKSDAAVVQPLLTSVLEKVKAAVGADALVKLVEEAAVDAAALLGSFSAELVCLQGGPDVGALVDEAFAAGKTPDEVLAVVNENADASKVDLSFLAERVSQEAAKAVFVVRTKADTDALAKFAPLLKAVAATPAAQAKVILAEHTTWFAKGKGRGLLKPVFKALLDLEIVSPAAFVAWKEDTETKKVKGKKEAIIQNIAFLKDVEAVANAKFADAAAGNAGDEEEEEQ